MRISSALHLSAASAALAVFVAPAHAQDEADRRGLDTIVVTAEKREQTLQDAAVAISAVAGNTLVEQSITQAEDLSRLFPSLQVARGSALLQIYLRGVGTFGANSWAEQGVAFNLDGVYLSRPAAPAGVFYDLERIEVLKGPQGTLYGRNASGGAMNVITAKPSFEEGLSGNINAEYGNYDSVKTSGALNAALNDTLAVRLSGQYSEHDGYYSDGYDDEDTHAIRGQIRYDNGSNVDINLMADYAHVGGMGSGGTIMPLLDGKNRLGPSDPAVIAEYLSRPPTAPVPQIVASDDGYQDNVFWGVIGDAKFDLGFAELTIVPAYRKTELDFMGYASSFLIDVIENSEQTSVEARLGASGPALTWVAGVYYFDETVSANQFYNQASNATSIISDLDTKSFAVFGQATYSLTDAFRVTGGLRYTKDNKKQDSLVTSFPFVGFVPPGPPACLPASCIPIILSIPTPATSDVDFEKVTWKAGVEFDAGPDSLLFANVSTGFKSGILYGGSGMNYSRPEKLTAYTIGSKNRFFDNTFQLNLEAFYWDFKDQQIAHLGPTQVADTPGGPIFGPVFLTENAGKATIFGAEAEMLWQPTGYDLFSANLQYLNTEYDELEYLAYSTSGVAPVIGCTVTPTSLMGASPTAAIFDVDCSGRSLVNAPKWSFQAGYAHTFELGAHGDLVFGANTVIESGRWLSIDFLDLGYQDSYTQTNLRLTYEDPSETFSITGFVNNVENSLIFGNSFQSPVKSGVIYNQLRPPRTYGVRLSVKF